MFAFVSCACPDKHRIWLLLGNYAQEQQTAGACKGRACWPVGTGPEVFSTWKPDLFWKALVQGRAFCGEKVVRDAGGSYETYEQKEKSYPRFCRGGYWGDVIWLELHGKLIKGPRLVPNELPGALSFDGPNHVCCESRCKLLSEVWAKDVDIGWQRRSNLGKAINQTTVFECAHHESVLWWGGSSCFSPP